MYVCLLALAAFFTTDVSSQRPGRGGRGSTVMVDGHEAIDGEVIVKYRDDQGALERNRAEAEADADEVEIIGRRGLRRMHSRRLGTHGLLAVLKANPDVEFAEPNYVIRVERTPNDASFTSLWGLLNTGQNVAGVAGTPGVDIGATSAWDITTGSRSTVVGVIDTGIDYNHPDLSANIWSAPSAFSVTVGGVVITCAAGTHGFNAINNTCNPMDDHNHGTHVSGTIGGVGNNGIGVTGVNWTASLMGLKFLGSTGSGSTSDAIKAIEFAIQAKQKFASSGGANVRILSNSWGGAGFSQALLDQINAANTNDMLFVAAAGNAASNNDTVATYPANYAVPNMVTVAATNNLDQRASFSNFGRTTVHLGAPGASIISTTRNNSYASFSGTSMATPHVAGVAALVLAECAMNTASLKAALLDSVDTVSALAFNTITGGRLNAHRAVQTCVPSVITSPAPGATLPGSTATFSWTAGSGATEFYLYVGSTPGGYDLYEASQGTNLSKTLTGLPTDGRTIYVRLYSRVGGYFRSRDYSYTASTQARAPAELMAPSSATVLSGPSTTFSWSAGVGVSEYHLYLGSTPGGYDLYDGPQGTGVSRTVSGLPYDGRSIHVTLWSKIDGYFTARKYVYSTADGRAAMTAPIQGATLAGSTTTFVWNAGSGVTEYYLYVGSVPGGYDVYEGSQGLNLSKTLTGLPIDGRTIYVRLWSKIGGSYRIRDYTYVGATLASAHAAIVTPTPGTTLTSSSVTFTWSAGVGVTEYYLYVGSTPAGYDLYNASQGTGLSRTVSGLPTDDRPIYVTLWSRINGVFSARQFLYTAP
jgi:serine protease